MHMTPATTAPGVSCRLCFFESLSFGVLEVELQKVNSKTRRLKEGWNRGQVVRGIKCIALKDKLSTTNCLPPTSFQSTSRPPLASMHSPSK
jgi:hypothetical protein